VQKAGLKSDLTPREVSVGVKETIELPAETIQERFGLGEKEGAAFVFAGQASLGLRGGGFLYTNQNTVSLGLVVSSEDLAQKKVEIQEVQTRFRLHPAVQRWLRGGKVVEYSAHLVPELGAGMMPRLWGDGVLVAGDAAGFYDPFTGEGLFTALRSAELLADTAHSALSLGDLSAGALAPYAQARSAARQLALTAGAGFVLVHVSTPLDVCEGRDRKGLYARAREGRLTGMTGIDDPYEIPTDADLVVDTSTLSIDEAVDSVIDYLVVEGWLDRP